MSRLDDDAALEGVIEHVARQLVIAAPVPDLRTRVLQRASANRPAPMWPIPATIAIAALLLLSVLMRRDSAPPPDRQTNHALTRAQAPRSETAPPLERVENSARAQTGPAITHRQSSRRVVLLSVTSPVAALAPPELSVPSIVVDEMRPVSSLEIPPLETPEPIAIAPLDGPEGERR